MGWIMGRIYPRVGVPERKKKVGRGLRCHHGGFEYQTWAFMFPSSIVDASTNDQVYTAGSDSFLNRYGLEASRSPLPEHAIVFPH